jgi:hypothetical protein
MSSRAKTNAVTALCAALACGMFLCDGCGSGDSKEAPLLRQIEKLNQDNAELTSRLEQSQADNWRLTKQIESISRLPKDKLENPYKVQRIKLSTYTNIYDKDKDGKKETLIVYLQPIDNEGDIIKAAGTVETQLWDLNNPNGQALLGEWRVDPSELRKCWYATIITTNYRLMFNIAGKIDNIAESLTVKVTFTDYLTGQIFEEQKVIKPQ